MASTDLGGDEFVGDALQGLSNAAIAKPVEVDPIPNVLVDDSSSSEDGDAVGQEDAPARGSRPTKAPLFEESKDGTEDWPAAAQLRDSEPSVGSRHEEDVEMDAAQGILYLSKYFLSVIIYLYYFYYFL